jgi:predicted metal-dependent enzyme (double-stranded beta helix superfamily)
MDDVIDAFLADTGPQAQLVYTDESGLTLVRARFDPNDQPPIHFHGTWGASASTPAATATRRGGESTAASRLGTPSSS